MAVCRLCLNTDVNMHNINNSKVHEVFEKLTSKQLPEKERPNTMCYLCYSQLKNCSRMLNLYRKAENVFEQLSYNSIEITNHTIPVLKRINLVNLQITPMNHIDIRPRGQTYEETDESIQKLIIKKEPNDELVQVKVEDIESEMECDVAEELQDVLYEDSHEESDDSAKDSTWDAAKEKLHFKKTSIKARVQDMKNNEAITDTTQMQNDEIAKKSLSCKICNKTFKQMCNLLEHTKKHNPKKHICSTCCESFSIKSNMLRHQEIFHEKNKHFLCDVCHKSFTRSDHLLLHMRSHKKEKPFPCSICNKMFSTPGNVQQHVNSIHLNKRPFACDQCSKTFNRKGNLQVHYRGHTGAKPYSCNKCDMRFAYISNLKKHIAITHSDSST